MAESGNTMTEAVQIPQGLEQKLEAPKGVSLVDKASAVLDKPIGETVANVEKKGIELAKIVDGFFGDLFRTGASSYSLIAGSPLLFAGPVGIVSLAVLVSTSYIATNLLYKIMIESGKFSYGVFRNPIKRIKSVTSWLASVVSNPVANIKRVFTMPQKVYEMLFEGGNHNKYGKIAGAILGGGFALESLMPNFLTGAVGASRLEAIASKVGGILSGAADKTLNAVTYAKEALTGYAANEIALDNPAGSMLGWLGQKFDAAFVYNY